MITNEQIDEIQNILANMQDKTRTLEITISGSPDGIEKIHRTVTAKCKGVQASNVFFSHQLVKGFFDKIDWTEVKL